MFSLFRLIALVCLLSAVMPEAATAQVSVRRGGAQREASPGKKNPRQKPKSGKSDTSRPAAAATPRAAQSQATAPAATAAPVKRQPKAAQRAEVGANGVTLRQQRFDEYQKRDSGTFTPWQHVVYRELDLTQGANASLYYPQEPQDGLVNMFYVILHALCQGQLKGYEFLDGREVLQPKYQVNVRDVLDRFQIVYTVKPAAGRDARETYEVDDTDVPSSEVLSYYIKEQWEFNQHTSSYGPRVLAVCPVLHRSGDWGGEPVSYPMFWLNFEDLRPLLRQHLIMSDGMNNAPRYTMEEFFALQHYDGQLYKVQNVRGLSLMQQYPNPDTLKVMRARIEAELRGFKDSIWVHEPTAAEVAQRDSVAAAQRAARRSERAARRGDKASRQDDVTQKRNRRTKADVDVEAAAAAQDAAADELEQRVEQTGTAHSARRSARRR